MVLNPIIPTIPAQIHNKTLSLLCRESAVFISHVFGVGIYKGGLLFNYYFLLVNSWCGW